MLWIMVCNIVTSPALRRMPSLRFSEHVQRSRDRSAVGGQNRHELLPFS